MGFELFNERHPNCQRYADMPSEVIETYSSRVHPDLLEEWKTNGLRVLAEGHFWFVNPQEFAAVAKEWFGADDYIVFARAAFGDLFLNKGTSVFHLFPHYGTYLEAGTNLELFFEVSLNERYFEKVLNGPLFRKSVKKFGQLASDEMFTFEPALALGGKEVLANINKVKLFPQLSILSQLHSGLRLIEYPY